MNSAGVVPVLTLHWGCGVWATPPFLKEFPAGKGHRLLWSKVVGVEKYTRHAAELNCGLYSLCLCG